MLKKYLGIVGVFALLMMAVPLLSLINVAKSDNPSSEKIIVLNHKTGETFEITMKDYIKGVVAAEMPASYEPEAIKAQAVVAHTYALRHINANALNSDNSTENSGTESGDTENNGIKNAALSTDPDKHQAYVSDEELKSIYGDNYMEYRKKISDAVDEVWDKIIMSDNQPIAAAFFAFSNGKTEDAANVWGQQVPYLVPVDSGTDKNAPNFNITVSIPAEEVLAALTKYDDSIAMPVYKEDWFEITERSDSGYVKKVKVGNKTLTGAQIRSLFELRSSDFEIKAAEDSFDFTTKGYGHAVGMSQYGANEMAKAGKTYDDILRHYYTGIEIVTE